MQHTSEEIRKNLCLLLDLNAQSQRVDAALQRGWLSSELTSLSCRRRPSNLPLTPPISSRHPSFLALSISLPCLIFYVHPIFSLSVTEDTKALHGSLVTNSGRCALTVYWRRRTPSSGGSLTCKVPCEDKGDQQDGDDDRPYTDDAVKGQLQFELHHEAGQQPAPLILRGTRQDRSSICF